MPEYVVAYYAGTMPETPEDGAAQRAEFQAWLEGLGDAVVNPGTPLRTSTTVRPDGDSEVDSSNRLVGFSVVAAESMDAAVEIAKACPYLKIGTVEVGEIADMGS